MTSIQHFTRSFSPFSSGTQPVGMAQSQTVGLDTLAEGSQYALEQLQLSREANGASAVDGGVPNPLRSSIAKPHGQQLYSDEPSTQHTQNATTGLRNLPQRDQLAEARSAIRKSSNSGPVRRRISRACDQCNQLRTKCDGQNPCAHCIGNDFFIHCAVL